MSKGPNVDRRDFVRLILAGGAGSLAGCSAEREPGTLPSPVDRPEDMIPGKVLEYATACTSCPAGCGVMVRTREARATKLEGLAEHPVNRGALCARGQAAIQHLYDPQRLRQPLRRNAEGTLEPVDWDQATSLLTDHVAALYEARRGASLALLSGSLGPTQRLLVRALCRSIGSSNVFEVDAFGSEPMRAAARICFGRELTWHLNLENAQMILSLGADFLETWLSPVQQARVYAAARRYRDGQIGIHTQVEPRLSLTGANADEWLAIRPGTEYAFALGLVHLILREHLDTGLDAETRGALERLTAPFTPEAVQGPTDIAADRLRHMARAFALARPAVALPPSNFADSPNATAAHVAVILLNLATGNLGNAIEPVAAPALEAAATHAQLLELRDQMLAGEIRVLLIDQTNPLFVLPQPGEWAAALGRVPLVVAFAATLDETAAHADLVLPVPTALESWGDVSPRQGLNGLQQPTMRPLYKPRQSGDVLIELATALGGEVAAAVPWSSFHDCLRDRWTSVRDQVAPEEPFEAFWQRSLQEGGVWGQETAETVHLEPSVLGGAWLPPLGTLEAAPGDDQLELLLFSSLHHQQGGLPSVPWLQEVPDPLAQVSWGPWVEIHPDTARGLQIQDGDLVAVTNPQGALRAPTHLNPWMRQGSVALPVGPRYTAVGDNAQAPSTSSLHLLPDRVEAASGAPIGAALTVSVERLGPRNQLLSPRRSLDQQERGLAPAVELEALRRGGIPPEQEAETHSQDQLYPEHEHPDHRWGMAIDTHACIGCNACSIACYAENNLAIVGRDQMRLGREMAWLRLEVYDDGRDAPDVRFLPMLCQQCDSAPCEPVCPVYATYHNPEGLNAQIYNRCVGTRYCSNNCPYKTRRFNWLQPEFPDPTGMQLNPSVTVRDAGVMEKCTFCVQRIQAAKHRAADEHRELADGEVVPACAQTCPTGAITFGDMKDAGAVVSRKARDPRAYTVLPHLNTRPAVHYLMKIIGGTRS